MPDKSDLIVGVSALRMPPAFITVPLRGRYVRVNPAAISHMQPDANGMAVVHLTNGSAFTALISPDWIERQVAGETLEEIEKAAKVQAKTKAAPAAAKAA
jgi:hypothetical protein